jgi:hypothetical protein
MARTSTAPAAAAAPVITNAFVLSGQVKGVWAINTAKVCVASNLGAPTGVGTFVTGFELTNRAFRPASDKWVLQFYVFKAGTTHFATKWSYNPELGAYTPKDKPDYQWLDGLGTVTTSPNFRKGRLDVTLTPYKILGFFGSKATAKETVVGNWDCG